MALMNSTPNSASSTDGSDTTFNTTVTSPFGNDTAYQNVTEGFTSGAAAGASIVSPIVMFLAGLIGNVLALMVLHKTKTEIRSMMFYTLVAALTWNDLLGICLTSPPVLAAYLNQRHMPALPTLCRFHALAMVCFGLSTPFIVCTMAIERSLALKCSYFYSKYCTPHSARLTVAALWVFVLFFGALPLFGVGSFTLQYPQTWCFLHFRSYVPLDMAYAGAYAVLNLLVIMVMIFCNGLVMTTLCRVRKSKRRMSSASSALLKADPADEHAKPVQQVRRRHHRDVELQMIWLLFAITTIFSVCWAPLMMYILYCLQSPDNSSPVFGLVAVRLASLNQTINPWIYVILRKSILSRLARLCRHYRCSCRHENHKTSQTSEPRRPTGFHNPPIYIQRKGTTPKSSSPKKYVHVGHQLCPSSQFVGLQELVPKDRIRSGKKKGSRGSRSQSSHKWGVSQAWGEVSSGGLCSACRDRLKGGSEGRGSSHSTHSSLPSFPQSCCGHVVPPVCSTVCEESIVDIRPPLSLPADGAYVDFFRHLPPAGIARPGDVTPGEDGAVTCHPKARGGDVSAENVLSTASEADDHGYSSKMSTDSSPVSTPERPRPDAARLHGDLTEREEEADTTPFAAGDEKFPATSFCSSHTKRPCAGGPEQRARGDLNEDRSVHNGGEQDALTVALDVKKMPLTGNVCRRHDSSGEGHTDGAHSGQTAACDDADSSLTAALKQKRLRTPNPHVKLDGFFRDDSVDITSGVFDCRDGGDDEDDGGRGDGGDDDDVYDDSLDPGQARKGDEGGEEGARGRRRVSSSRTLSSSSGGTLVDCGSGQDTGRAYFRQCSSSSAQ